MATHPKQPKPKPAARAVAAPAGYEPSAFPSFAVTVDVVILTLIDERLHVLVVRRGAEPFHGDWALPGGFKRPDESLDDAARRELREETGVDAATHLSQLGAYGDPERDPRMNVVTIAYLAVLRDVGNLQAGTDADAVALRPVSEVIDGKLALAFDHQRIVTDAVERARTDLETTSLATAFVGPAFTLSELRNVYEAVWETDFDPANFRRTVLSTDSVKPTGKHSSPGAEGGRPPELYRASRSWDHGSPLRRPKLASPPRPRKRPQP